MNNETYYLAIQSYALFICDSKPPLFLFHYVKTKVPFLRLIVNLMPA